MIAENLRRKSCKEKWENDKREMRRGKSKVCKKDKQENHKNELENENQKAECTTKM